MGFWSRNFPEAATSIRKLRRSWREMRMLRHLQKAGRYADLINHEPARHLIDMAILSDPRQKMGPLGREFEEAWQASAKEMYEI